MTTSCPCCGQALKDLPLKVSLEFNTIICGDVALEVTPKECEIVFVLQKSWPHTTSQRKLMEQVWGGLPVDDVSMRNMVYNTRKQVNKIGYTIRAVRSRGYRLERLGMFLKK